MKANFDRCMAEVFRHEGGYANDPRDPGGETNMGISKRSYPGENIKGMTRDRAALLYRRDFWNPIRGDDLPAGMDLVAFDAAVNSGISKGAKWLQQALGVAPDGKIGPATLAKAKQTPDDAKIINQSCDLRLIFLASLKKLWPVYSKGWTRRVEAVRAEAIRMASGAAPSRPASPPPAIPTAPPVGKKRGVEAWGIATLVAAAFGGLGKWLGWW